MLDLRRRIWHCSDCNNLFGRKFNIVIVAGGKVEPRPSFHLRVAIALHRKPIA
jgi:hypothetical protein